MATYNVVSVLRTPQSATVPTYTELGPLHASTITVKDYKTMQPSECKVVVNLDSIDASTKASLLDLAATPLEVWVYRDGVRIFAGPVLGGSVKSNALDLTMRGRLAYLAYMLVWQDKSFASVDLFTIAATLVNDWQALTYGNYGVLTSGVGTLGTTRSLEIPGATEFPSVLDSLKSISKGSFDVWIDPSTGDLEFAAARGTDLSASVSVERGLTDVSAGFALGPGLLASEVYAIGTAADSVALTTSASDATLRASFGRSGKAVSHDPVTDSAHLTDLVTADLADVGEVYFTPGGDLFEVPEAVFENLEPGNTVEYSYDAGLGKFTSNKRVEKRQVSIGIEGQEKIQVEFE